MSYEDQAELYRDVMQRSRMDIAVKERAYFYTSSADVEIKALGEQILGGDVQMIDAVIVAVVVQPGSNDIDTDAKLKALIDLVWPTVASALSPA